MLCHKKSVQGETSLPLSTCHTLSQLQQAQDSNFRFSGANLHSNARVLHEGHKTMLATIFAKSAFHHICVPDAEKENRLGLSLLLSPKNFKPILKRKDAIARQSSETAKLRHMQEKLKQMLVEKEKAEALLKQQENSIQSLSKQLEETHEKLNHVCLEKEKTQDLLEEKGNVLRLKDEQLEKLRFQLNKLRKLKEFKPTLNLSFIQEEVEKKTASPEKKRPSSSAYMMWRKDHWEMVKKENPNAKLKEICNILALKWKNLSAEEKKPYEARHLADKKSHLEIIKKGSENRTDLAREEQRQQAAIELLEQYLLFRKETDKEIKKTRKELDPSKPKKPLSAFFLFLNERRSALLAEKKNAFEIAKVAGEEWRNMNEEEQAPYKETAKKLKEEHLLQMELYKQNKGLIEAGNIFTMIEQMKPLGT